MRGGLRRVADAAAIPYGFTILIAASGGMLIRSHGPPDLAGGLMLACGAALAFASVALAARGADPAPLPGAVLLGLSSGCAAATGTVVADLIARGVHGSIAFGLVAYTATFTYFVTDAIGVWLITSRRRSRSLGNPSGEALWLTSLIIAAWPQHEAKQEALDPNGELVEPATGAHATTSAIRIEP